MNMVNHQIEVKIKKLRMILTNVNITFHTDMLLFYTRHSVKGVLIGCDKNRENKFGNFLKIII